MPVFELKPKNEKPDELEIVPSEERQTQTGELPSEKFEDLVRDLEWTQRLLEEYKNETDEKLKKQRFEALNEAFNGLKLEERFGQLNSGDEDGVSDQFLRFMDIKNAIEEDWYMYQEKAA